MDQTTSHSGDASGTETAATGTESAARRYATGRQYELRRGDALAVVTELAAGLRLYSRGGTQLTETYGDAQIPPGATGITLAPWANRVEDGIWHLDGKKQQLDITEVSRNNASHGLLRNASYGLVDESQFSVTLEAVIFPQHGYPCCATASATNWPRTLDWWSGRP
jgi:aldose 1-epimerase